MQNPTLYFSDRKKTIDFVLVYKNSDMTEQKKLKLEYFLDSILRTGLDIETEPFTEQTNIVFVKVHIPREIAIRYSEIVDIDLAFRSKVYRPTVSLPYRFLATPLTLPNPEDEVYLRAPETVSGMLPQDVTSAEKIMVLEKILARTKYGDNDSDYGIRKLLKHKVFFDAFPLHEGPYEWTNSGPLTDRQIIANQNVKNSNLLIKTMDVQNSTFIQLLAKFWGSPWCWYKEQPLNLIEKYYGTEMAFYFAWCGFYLKMLLPVSVLAIACILYGVLTMLDPSYNTDSGEICGSNKLMCPRCHYLHCKYEKLSSSCVQSYITYVHDNIATIAFAVIIAFWATIFIELWQRNEAVLQIHWNVKSLEYDSSLRPEYVEAAVSKKNAENTSEYEPQIPRGSLIARYTLTLATIALLVTIMIIAMFGVMAYRITVVLILIRDSKDVIIKKNTKAIASMTGSMISACLILFFKVVCRKVAMWLTDIENHRTQYEFDNSFVYKTYALEFTNNYSAVIYIAFLKGRLYTYPGDMSLWSKFGGLGSDICDPTGCIMDLTIQLLAILVVKIFCNNMVQILVPLMKGLLKKKMHNVQNNDIPLYEKEFLLPHTDRYFLIDEYMDMVIQYGFIVFFVASFPLAPVLALVNNFVELRVDSYKITRNFRRPVPRKVIGLGAWFGILQAITYVGVATNAVVLAFNSDLLAKLVYWYKADEGFHGFVNNSLSVYATKDFAIERSAKTDIPAICYYPGNRYPPSHPQQYELTSDYMFILAMRFLVVAVFEHVIVSLKGILAYAIPDVPAHVTEQLAIQERKNKEARMQVMNDEFLAQYKAAGLSTAAKAVDLN